MTRPARASVDQRAIREHEKHAGHGPGRYLMAELSTRKRNAEPKSDFGLPEKRKYPMPDKSHARNAKARAAQQEEKGNLSSADKKKIDRKADRILDK
jgi:hypothetical protein